jgi:hypothetical protein
MFKLSMAAAALGIFACCTTAYAVDDATTCTSSETKSAPAHKSKKQEKKDKAAMKSEHAKEVADLSVGGPIAY